MFKKNNEIAQPLLLYMNVVGSLRYLQTVTTMGYLETMPFGLSLPSVTRDRVQQS